MQFESLFNPNDPSINRSFVNGKAQINSSRQVTPQTKAAIEKLLTDYVNGNFKQDLYTEDGKGKINLQDLARAIENLFTAGGEEITISLKDSTGRELFIRLANEITVTPTMSEFGYASVNTSFKATAVERDSAGKYNASTSSTDPSKPNGVKFSDPINAVNFEEALGQMTRADLRPISDLQNQSKRLVSAFRAGTFSTYDPNWPSQGANRGQANKLFAEDLVAVLKALPENLRDEFCQSLKESFKKNSGRDISGILDYAKGIANKSIIDQGLETLQGLVATTLKAANPFVGVDRKITDNLNITYPKEVLFGDFPELMRYDAVINRLFDTAPNGELRLKDNIDYSAEIQKMVDNKLIDKTHGDYLNGIVASSMAYRQVINQTLQRYKITDQMVNQNPQALRTLVNNILDNGIDVTVNGVTKKMFIPPEGMGYIKNIANLSVKTLYLVGGEYDKKSNMPKDMRTVQLVGGYDPATKQYTYVELTTGRPFTGKTMDDVIKNFCDNNPIAGPGYLFYHNDTTGKLEQKDVHYTAWQRTKDVGSTILGYGGLVVIAAGGISGAEPVAFVGLGMLAGSSAISTASVIERYSKGENIKPEEWASVIIQDAMVASSFLKIGLMKLYKNSNTPRFDAFIQKVALPATDIGTYAFYGQTVYDGLAAYLNKDSEKAFNVLFNLTLVATLAGVNARARQAMNTKNYSETAKVLEREVPRRAGESDADFVTRVANETEAKMKIMDRKLVKSIKEFNLEISDPAKKIPIVEGRESYIDPVTGTAIKGKTYVFVNDNGTPKTQAQLTARDWEVMQNGVKKGWTYAGQDFVISGNQSGVHSHVTALTYDALSVLPKQDVIKGLNISSVDVNSAKPVEGKPNTYQLQFYVKTTDGAVVLATIEFTKTKTGLQAEALQNIINVLNFNTKNVNAFNMANVVNEKVKTILLPEVNAVQAGERDGSKKPYYIYREKITSNGVSVIDKIVDFYKSQGINESQIQVNRNTGEIYILNADRTQLLGRWRWIGFDPLMTREETAIFKNLLSRYEAVYKKAGLDQTTIDLSDSESIMKYFSNIQKLKSDCMQRTSIEQIQLPNHQVETIKAKAWVRFFGEKVLKNYFAKYLEAELVKKYGAVKAKEIMKDVVCCGYGNAFEGGGGSLKTDIDYKVYCHQQYFTEIDAIYRDFIKDRELMINDSSISLYNLLNNAPFKIELELKYVVQTYESVASETTAQNGFLYYINKFFADDNTLVFGSKEQFKHLTEAVTKNMSKDFAVIAKALFDNGLGLTIKLESRDIIENLKTDRVKKYLKEHDVVGDKYAYLLKLYYTDNQLVSSGNMANVTADNWIWPAKYSGLRVIDFEEKTAFYGKASTYFTSDQLKTLPAIERLITKIQFLKTKYNLGDHTYFTAKDFEVLFSSKGKLADWKTNTKDLYDDLKATKIFSSEQLNTIRTWLESGKAKEAGLEIMKRLNEYLSVMPKM